MGTERRDTMHGALVGWHVEDLGQRMVLTVETVSKPPPHHREDVHKHRFVLDRNQSVQLGNYLFEMSGQAPRRGRRKPLLDRLLGA
ncbi:hypothetical protein [Alteraurantiacibacter aquimixticola]|uniref:Uncharacterized protein n=1 Tax=Alteraurantiacibacter aquimixticola TaxID=2489173 RepID=A0A4V4U8G1_9SPHN|nr:hypothetical protein [Alteraurantiacibacter aquimixticola]TIX49790.1 hypothetical protein E5222_13355 [Alteraurantiacibacter aquimixticola]